MIEQKYMDRAIAIAEIGMTSGAGGPFGALVVRGNDIIAEGHNEVILTNDPTAHAEVVAIRRACAALGDFQLTDCVIYCSCEPCPMCLGAIYWARPKLIVYACTKSDAADIGFDDDFIYQELDKAHGDRSIPMVGVDNTNALKVFKMWSDTQNKTLY